MINSLSDSNILYVVCSSLLIMSVMSFLTSIGTSVCALEMMSDVCVLFRAVTTNKNKHYLQNSLSFFLIERTSFEPSHVNLDMSVWLSIFYKISPVVMLALMKTSPYFSNDINLKSVSKKFS